MAAVKLAAQVTGDGPPLVILHGLFGSARNWASIARRLGDIRQVHALDLRNHGASPWAEPMAYADMADDVAAYIEGLPVAPTDLLGHSMGGKAAMVLALTRPALIGRLIVVDIAPVASRGDGFSGIVQALQGVDPAIAQRRSEVDEWLAAAIPEASLRAFLLQNLVSDEGRLRWRLNLPAIAANMPSLTGFPDLAGARYTGPTTFLAGELSDYLRPRDEPAIHRLFPAARLLEIGQAGHWPHAEQPERFLELVRQALS